MYYDWKSAIHIEHLCYPGGFQIYGCEDSTALFGMVIFCLVVFVITGIRLFGFYRSKIGNTAGQLLRALRVMVVMYTFQIITRVAELSPGIPVTVRSFFSFTVSSLIYYNTVNTSIFILRMIPEYLLDSQEFSDFSRKIVYLLRKKGSVLALGIVSSFLALLTQLGWLATSLRSEMLLTIYYPSVVSLFYNAVALVSLYSISKSLARVRAEFESVQKDLGEIKNISSVESTASGGHSTNKSLTEREMTLKRFDIIIQGIADQVKLLGSLMPLTIYLIIAFNKVTSNQYYRWPFSVIIEVVLPFLAMVQSDVGIRRNKIDPVLEELEEMSTSSQI